MRATRVAVAPTIDGRLDDRAWVGVAPDRRFTESSPKPGEAPSEATDVYIVYDDQSLYVGVRCHDRDAARITERLTRRDRETEADRVSISIDSRHDHLSAYVFDLNVSGVLLDGLRYNDTEVSADWDGIWYGRTSRDAAGWSAEVAIPWRTLRFTGAAPEMGLQVARYVQRRGEWVAWSFVPRSERGEVSRYGTLSGLSGLRPRRLFQLAPYVAARVSATSSSGSRDGVEVTPTAGLDLKLGVTSSLTLDATLNPDFGQVEADQVNLNLSTFEIFFPEKRPFFLEGADLFASPIQQFYTRRVGRPAAGGRVLGAARLTGRIIPHLSIAALDALTSEPVATGDGERTFDALANYGVLRLRADFGQSYVGALATVVNRFEPSPGGPGPGPVADCPAGRCSRDAYTAGVDAQLATRGGKWQGKLQAVMSRIEHGPTVTQPDGVTIGPRDTGVGLFANGRVQANSFLTLGVEYQGFSPQLDLADAGYLRRANFHRAFAFLRFRAPKPFGPIVDLEAVAFTHHDFSWDGVRLWNEVGLNCYILFKNFWDMWFEVIGRVDRFDNRETRDGTISERVGGWEVNFYAGSDQRRRLFAQIEGSGNATQRGAFFYGQLRLALRPLPQLELDLIPRGQYTFGDPRWVETEQLPGDGAARRYWFGDQTAGEFDVTLRGTYTFTPRLTLQLYAQLFVSGGRYGDFYRADTRAVGQTLRFGDFTPAPPRGREFDFRDGALNLNAVVRWEYLPGSTLLLVYTRAQTQTDYLPGEGAGGPRFLQFRAGPATDHLLVKLTYLWG